ncbi:MAG: hypothetical protein ACE5IL_00580 [Myxococcota bacterium]
MGRTTAVALTTILLSGCVYWMDPGWISERGRLDAVRAAADGFGHDLRWGRVAEAAGAVEPEVRAAFVEVATDLYRELRFSDFEVQSIQMGPDKEEASVDASFELYPIASIQETSFRVHQQWRYDRELRRWLLTPNLGIYRAQLASAKAIQP